MMDEQENEWALEVIEQAKRDHKTILALREQLDRARTQRDEARVALDAANAALATATDDLGSAQDEIDALRADLKRYAAVYGDPDAPVDAPRIKVGDHVRCESLGDLTGIVEVVNPSEVPGWNQCLVRDDREGHVWGAAAWILEVLP